MLYSWEREYSLTVAGDWPQLGTLTAERHLNVFQALVHSPPIAQVAGLCLCQWGAKGMKDGAGPSESLHKAHFGWLLGVTLLLIGWELQKHPFSGIHPGLA